MADRSSRIRRDGFCVPGSRRCGPGKLNRGHRVRFGDKRGDEVSLPYFGSPHDFFFRWPFCSTLCFINTGWRVFLEELLSDSSTEAGTGAPVLHRTELHGTIRWD